MNKVKNVYVITIAKAATTEELEEDGLLPQHMPDGRLCLPLGEMRAGAMLGESERECRNKAIRTAIHFWKKQYEEYAEDFLEAQSVKLVRQKVVN